MSNRSSSRAMGTGLILLVLAVSAGVNSVGGGFVLLLLSFAGVLAGANVIAVGVLLAEDHPAGAEGGGAGALTALFMRRSLAFAGLALVSSASTAVAGETGPAFCIGAFVLLLLGLSLINIRLLRA